MDPTANLAEQLEVAGRIFAKASPDDDAFRLAELVDALHGWINHGGFLPAAWELNRPKGSDADYERWEQALDEQRGD